MVFMVNLLPILNLPCGTMCILCGTLTLPCNQQEHRALGLYIGGAFEKYVHVAWHHNSTMRCQNAIKVYIFGNRSTSAIELFVHRLNST